MESRLIKDTRPPFNTRLVDDKTFPYLVVTMRDDFPGVFITREPTHEDYRGSKVFGPFASAGALREAVQLLQRVFRYRTCHLDIEDGDPKNRRFRPCLLHSIGQCTAPCADRISKASYRRDVDAFVRFLGSKRSTMLRELREEMAQASADLRFEDAAKLRDRIMPRSKNWTIGRSGPKMACSGNRKSRCSAEIRHLRSSPCSRTLGLTLPIRSMEAIDIAHLQGGETVGSKVCFVDGRPFKDLYRRFKIRTVDNDDYAAIREVVSRRYRDAGVGEELYPDLILIDGGLGQLHAAMEAFADLLGQAAHGDQLGQKG